MRSIAVSTDTRRPSWRRPLTGVAVVAVIGAGLGAYFGIRVAQGAGSAPTTGQPPARTEAAMAFDASDGTVVLYGGQGRSGSLGDTWIWDGSTWTQAHPSTSPPPLAGARMAYDPISHDLVLIGGQRIRGSMFDGGVACSSAGSSGAASGSGSAPGGTATFIPPSNATPAMAPIPSATAGSPGRTPDCTVTDVANANTWLWNGHDWSKAAGTTPSAGYFGDWNLATDPVTNRAVLLGGRTLIAEPLVPITTPGHGIVEPNDAAPTPAMACPIPVDGTAGTVEPACPFYPAVQPAWSWNGHAWTEMKVTANDRHLPLGAYGSTVVTDAVSGRLAVFSSDFIALPVTCDPATCATGSTPKSGACCTGVVSVWNGSGWKQAATFKSGPLMTSGTFVGDPAAHGDVYLTAEGQTWLWTGAWTRLHPGTTPPVLNGVASAYDASTGQVVLFGGFGATARVEGLYNQTWTWDGSTWTMRGGTVSPSVSVPVPSPVSLPPYYSCSGPPAVKPAPEPQIACPMIGAGGGASGASGNAAGSGIATP